MSFFVTRGGQPQSLGETGGHPAESFTAEEDPKLANDALAVAGRYRRCRSAVAERCSEDRSNSAEGKRFLADRRSPESRGLPPSQLARPVIVEQNRVRTELFREQDCAHLAGTQTVFSLRRIETGWILNCSYFHPFRLRHLRCSGQPGASDDNFVVHLRRDINTWKKSMEAVKAAKLGKNDQRR